MTSRENALSRQLAELQATLAALVSGEVDAVVDNRSLSPVLLSKAQAALSESEERYRRIVETSNEGIWSIDTDSRVTFVNTRLAKLLGYSVEQMLGRSLFDFLPEVPGIPNAMRRQLETETGLEEEHARLVRSDGSDLWMLVNTCPIHTKDGKFAGTLAMLTDRTRHRQAEAALRKSEEQYRQIVETTSDGIIKVDDQGLVVFVNGRLAKMLGYELSELIGRSSLAFLSGDAQQSAAEQIGFNPERPIDTTFHRKDGTDVAVSVSVSRLIGADGAYVGYLGVVRDVTERNRLLSQLMVSDRMASVGTLAAGVAHEINNPLAAVIANLHCVTESVTLLGTPDAPPMTERWLEEDIRAPLQDACSAAERVRFIVRDLGLFSRSPSKDPVGGMDVNTVMESSIRMAWNEIRHRASLLKSYGEVPRVEGNEARLGQVFLNLLVNAAQALPVGSVNVNEIHVSSRLENGRVIVEVRDTGVGIAPEIIGRIFDVFFTTKEAGAGSGLGLAISHRIVTDLGGELTVESRLGQGATFRVSLPASTLQPLLPSPALAVVPGRRGRILVVDDDASVLQSVKRVLGKDHDVVTVCDGAEALALCAAGQRFDLVLCDLMMPAMSGMELHHKLGQVAPEQSEKMIFLTGGAFTDSARLFLAELPREQLQKPFDPDNLRFTVQRFLE